MSLPSRSQRGLAWALVTLMTASLGGTARADGSPALDDTRLDMSVPNAPAFTALGVSPSSISQPTNLKDLAIALASGVDGSGSVQNGLAIEVAPWKFVRSGAGVHQATLADRLLGGLALSLGTDIVGTAPGETTSIAYGARWILGGYDPTTDVDGLGACLGASLSSPALDVSGVPGPDPNAPVVQSGTTDAPQSVKRPSLADCRAMFRAAHLTSFAVEFAYAHVDEAVGSTMLSDLHPDDDIGWVSVSVPLPKPFRSFTEEDVSFVAALAAYEREPKNSVEAAIASAQAVLQAATDVAAKASAAKQAADQARNVADTERAQAPCGDACALSKAVQAAAAADKAAQAADVAATDAANQLQVATTQLASANGLAAALHACEGSQATCRTQHEALWSAVWQYRAAQKPGAHAAAFAPILFGRVDDKRIDATQSPRQTELQLSARLPYITDRWSAFIEGGYKWTNLGGNVTPTPQNAAPLGLGGDVRLGNGTWIGLYFGYDAISGTLLSLANLKWAIGENRPYSY